LLEFLTNIMGIVLGLFLGQVSPFDLGPIWLRVGSFGAPRRFDLYQEGL
jgi:hypothetical protein